jgi:hypothetical protein
VACEQADHLVHRRHHRVGWSLILAVRDAARDEVHLQPAAAISLGRDATVQRMLSRLS